MMFAKRSRFTFSGKPVYFSRHMFTDAQFDPRTGIFVRILQSVLNEAAYDDDFVQCLELGKAAVTTVQTCYAVRPLVIKVAAHHDVVWAQHANKGFAKTLMPFVLIDTIPEEELGKVTIYLKPTKKGYVLKAVYGGVRIWPSPGAPAQAKLANGGMFECTRFWKDFAYVASSASDDVIVPNTVLHRGFRPTWWDRS